MPRKLTPKQVYEDLMGRHEPEIARAFMRAVNDLRRAADRQRFLAALASGNIEAAIGALNLDEAAFSDLSEAIRAAYLDAGRANIESFPGAVATVRFSGRNFRAEAWLREHSAQLVTHIIEDQRAAVRAALVEAMAQGAAPRSVALTIMGRMNRVTGAREGGVLGLSSPQEIALRRARDELASGDVSALRAYLQRTRRDRRFDRSVTRAIREGGKVSPEIANRAVTAYSRRLLELRGQTIGRTEAMSALGEAQNEALNQAVEAGAIQENQIRRVWRSAGDLRVRDTHKSLNGESVGLRERFISPSGASLRFPADPSAPVSERANCRCWLEPRIDFLANVP